MMKKEKNMYKKLGYLAKVQQVNNVKKQANRSKITNSISAMHIKIFLRHFSFKFKKFESILSVLCNQNLEFANLI